MQANKTTNVNNNKLDNIHVYKKGHKMELDLLSIRDIDTFWFKWFFISINSA